MNGQRRGAEIPGHCSFKSVSTHLLEGLQKATKWMTCFLCLFV